MDTQEANAAVSAIIEAAGFKVSVTGGYATKRDEWECDGWRLVFEKQTRSNPAKPYDRFEFEYFTGTGHRKLSKIDAAGLARDLQGAVTAIHRRNITHRYEVLKKPVAPHPAGVLYGLLLDGEAAHMSFPDWCDNYGSDPDSMKAHQTYMSCCETGQKLEKMFTREQLQALREALQDY